MERKSLHDLYVEPSSIYCHSFIGSVPSIIERRIDGKFEVWYRVGVTKEFERKLSCPEGTDDEQETEYQNSNIGLN